MIGRHDRASRDAFIADIRDEPATVDRVAEAYGNGFAGLADDEAGRLADHHVVLVGMGSSANACVSAQWHLASAGIQATAVSASELDPPIPSRDGRVALVAVSNSGGTSEVLAAIERFRASHDGPVLGITADPASRLAQDADHAWQLPIGPEGSFAAKSYAASVGVLLALVARLADARGRQVDVDWRAASAAARAMQDAGLSSELVSLGRDAGCLVFLGSSSGMAAAREGALLAAEVLRLPALAVSTSEFLHGQANILSRGSALVVVLDRADDDARQDDAIAAIEEMSTPLFIVGDRPRSGRDRLLALPSPTRDIVEATSLELLIASAWSPAD